jgi:hypothetical protein
MRIKFLTTFLIVTSSLSGQPGLRFSQLEYNGRVKSVLEENFRAVFENDSLVGYEYELFGSDKLVFDTLNRVITKYDYKPARDIDTLEVKKVWKYFYSEGRLDSIYHDPPDTTKIWKYDKRYFYYYRNDSTVIIHKPRSRNELEESIITNYVDTIRHYRITSIKYPRSGTIDQDVNSKSLIRTEIHQKDTLGRIEKSLYYNYDTLKKIKIFKYEKFFNQPIREQIFYLPKGLLFDSDLHEVDYKYELNENGDPIKHKYLDSNDGFKTWTKYYYQYDKNKNWVVREKHIKGKIYKLDKRTFEYH